MPSVGLSLLVAVHVVLAQGEPPTLEQTLLAESRAGLVRAVRDQGNAIRGAAVFYQPQLACAKCHEGATPLGPDLPKLGKQVTEESIIGSILNPSEAIKKGYETARYREERNRVNGAAEERPGEVVVETPQDGRLLTVPRRSTSSARRARRSRRRAESAGRSRHLDPVRYLVEIATGPTALASFVQVRASGSASLPNMSPGRSGMIAGLEPTAPLPGAAIYDRVCGTATHEGWRARVTRPPCFGQVPRMAADLHGMYRRLRTVSTRCPADLASRQKYDGIHYIRRDLPRATTRPSTSPSTAVPDMPRKGGQVLPGKVTPGVRWTPVGLMAAGSGKHAQFAKDRHPARSCHMGVSSGNTVVYDHDTMRLAAAWEGSGFIDWNCVIFSGRHEVHPRVVGKVRLANGGGLGWANPESGSFLDPRLKGRDQRAYGPLPRSWARYKGVYHFGDRVVVSYSVGSSEILETPGLEFNPAEKDVPIFTRTLNVGKSARDLLMRVAPAANSVATVGDQRLELSEQGGEWLLPILSSVTPTQAKILAADGFERLCKTTPRYRTAVT